MTPSTIARGFAQGSLAQLLLLAAAMGAGGYVRTALSPVQESMRLALGLSDTHMAVLQGPAVGLPFILAAAPLGLLIDRTRRNRLLLALLALSLAGSLLTALSESFVLLLVARAVAGVSGLALLPVILSLVADLYPAERRGRATTMIVIGQAIGNSAAFALGGSLLSMWDADAQGWRFAMAGMSAPIALVLLLTLAVREPPRRDVAVIDPSLGRVWRELAEHRAIVGALCAGVIILETAVGALLVWGAPLLARRFDMPPVDVGAAMGAAMLLSGVVGPAAGGFLADRCQAMRGPRLTTTVLAMVSLAAAPLSAFHLAPDPAWMLVLLTSAMTVLLAGAIMGMTLFTIVIPNELRGLCTSLLMAGILFGALAVAPVLVSALSGALGGEHRIAEALGVVCIASAVLGAGCFALARGTLSGTASTGRLIGGEARAGSDGTPGA